MTAKRTFARIALCALAHLIAYVVGAYGTAWHVTGYDDLTYRTRLLQCAAEAALFLLPSVGLLVWAAGRCERAALERLRNLNLLVECAGALGIGAALGLVCSIPFLVIGYWFPPAKNQTFALTFAGAGLLLFLVGSQSRSGTLYRLMEAAIWATTTGLCAWILIYR
jgi:hypothetical protein